MDELIDRSRRRFIVATTAVGGGFVLAPLIEGCAPGEDASLRQFAPNPWLRIGPDGAVTVYLSEVELGQGVMTALPALVAEELEVELDAITVEPAPLTADYGSQRTGSSESVRNAWDVLREAGATAREMLKAAASRAWGVAPEDCVARDGRVHHAASGRSSSYGELVALAADVPVPSHVRLKPRSAWRLIGKSTPRLDALEKVTGRAVFGLDVRLPGMLSAAIRHCPVFGGRLASFDAEAAMTMPGVRSVVPLSDAVAVVAVDYWTAEQALAAVAVEWDLGEHRDNSDDRIRGLLTAALEGTQSPERDDGSAADIIAGAADAERISAEYFLPFQAHATMEPLCCTAHVRDGTCEVWVSTQTPSDAQFEAFTTLYDGVPELWEKVKRRFRGTIEPVQLHRTFVGGGFGRRLYSDFVREAVTIAMSVDAPVKLVWSRSEDIQHDYYRAATAHRLDAALDRAGTISAWRHRIAGPDARAGGAADLPYAIPHIRVECARVDSGVPVGRWRSVEHSYNAFAVECFVDECAARLAVDPVQLRLELLRNEPRLREVVRVAAESAGWGNARPGRYLGIAAHKSFGTYVAQVAEVSVEAGSVIVHRLVCCCDCGTVVNPAIVRAQLEGAVVFGLTSALKSSITIRNGRVEQSNLHDFPLLRIGETPRTEVVLLDSEAEPGGVGEPGVPPVAPAVANAVFAATGRPVRALPIAV